VFSTSTMQIPLLLPLNYGNLLSVRWQVLVLHCEQSLEPCETHCLVLDLIRFGNWKSNHDNRVDNVPVDCDIWRASIKPVHCHDFNTHTPYLFLRPFLQDTHLLTLSVRAEYIHSARTESVKFINMYTWTSSILYLGMIHYHFNKNYTFQNLPKT
jgi:hypothetical protein